MELEVDEEPQSPDMEMGQSSPLPAPEPRITNRAQGGMRTDKTRFIRPVERQRMRPWLIDHLDKNDIPGLVWQDRREKIFRISWKHAANQCFNMQKDTNLFERWAIHTGRHQDSDHKRWKANFRCALNSLPDVAEMKEQGVKKGNNAFKVYRFLDEKEAKAGKESKARKKREAADLPLSGEANLVKIEDEFKTYHAIEGTSFGIELVSGGAGTSLPDLHQLVPGPSGVDLLLEADSKERLQPAAGAMDNLHEILAAATASLAAGGDAQALEKISIEQLSRLGEVSRIKLDIRQSDRKRRKKEVSGILNVFLCNWCEKVFPTKTDLFQHFLVLHQDKLLSGEDYGAARKPAEHSEKLQQEIEDLEKKVLGFTQETYQPKDSEEVIEDGQVVDLSSDNSMTSQDVYIEDHQVLDLSVAGALAKIPQPQLDVALDLSMNSAYKQKSVQKNGTPKTAQKRRRSSANGVNYNDKFGNYGLAGAPRTKRQMSLLLKRKEEEEEKQRKQAEAQHSMEDIVHAEILMSLKSGSQEENEGETAEAGNMSESKMTKCETEMNMKENDDKTVDNESHETSGVGGKKMTSDKDNEECLEEKEDVSSNNMIYIDTDESSTVHIIEQTCDVQSDPRTDSNGSSVNKMSDFNPIQKYDEKANSGKPYKCALCEERFEDPTELLQHVSVHKMEYTCSVCMEVMTDKNVYLSHVESHLPAVKYKEKCVNETGSKTSSIVLGDKDFSNGCFNSRSGQVNEANFVNEKGAAGAKLSNEEKADESNCHSEKNIENTGQKNLQAEPAVVPAAGSDNSTGNESLARNQVEDHLDGEINRKLSTQESFEIESLNCEKMTNLQRNEKNNIMNDVVDGEQKGSVNSASKPANFVTVENVVREVMKKKTIKDNDLRESTHVGRKLLSYDMTVPVIVIPPVEGIKDTHIDDDKKLNHKPCESYNSEKDDVSVIDVISTNDQKQQRPNFALQSTLDPNETLEDEIRNNVFHCGLCDKELLPNDLQDHLQSHKIGVNESKTIMLPDDDCSCMICKQTVPVNKFHSHLKSHSVYELSQAQNLALAQASSERRESSSVGKPPFTCNLCSVKFMSFSDLKEHVKTHLFPTVAFPTIVKTKFVEHKADTNTLSERNRLTMKQNSTDVKKQTTVVENVSADKLIKQKAVSYSKASKVKPKLIIKTEKIENYINHNKTKPPDSKTETFTSSAIAAALNSGPKYRTSVLEAGNFKKIDSASSLHIKLSEATTFGSEIDCEGTESVKHEPIVVIKRGDKNISVIDKDPLKAKKRKLDDQQLLLKRPKLALNETLSNSDSKSFGSHIKAVCSENCVASIDPVSNEEPANRVIFDGRKNEDHILPSSNIEEASKVTTISESRKMDNSQSAMAQLQSYLHNRQLGVSKLISSGLIQKKTTASTDSSTTRAQSSTLRNLQQKILLVKQGPVTVATPVYAPSSGTSVLTHIDNPNHPCQIMIKSSDDETNDISVRDLGSAIPVSVFQNLHLVVKDSNESILSSLVSQQTSVSFATTSSGTNGQTTTQIVNKTRPLSAFQSDKLSVVNVSEIVAAVARGCKYQDTVNKTRNQIHTRDVSSSIQPSIPPVSISQTPLRWSTEVLQGKVGNIPDSQFTADTLAGLNSSTGAVVCGSVATDSNAVIPVSTDSLCSTGLQQFQMQHANLKRNPSKQCQSIKQSQTSDISNITSVPQCTQTVHDISNTQTSASDLESSAVTDGSSLYKLVFLPFSQVTNATILPGIKAGQPTPIFVPASSPAFVSDSTMLAGRSSTVSALNIGQLNSVFDPLLSTTQATVSARDKCYNKITSLSTLDSSKKYSQTNIKEPMSDVHMPPVVSSTPNICTDLERKSSVSALQSPIAMPSLISTSPSPSLCGLSSSVVKPSTNLIMICGFCREALRSSEQTKSHVCKMPSVKMQNQGVVPVNRLVKSSGSRNFSINNINTTKTRLSLAAPPTNYLMVPGTSSLALRNISNSSLTDVRSLAIPSGSKTATAPLVGVKESTLLSQKGVFEQSFQTGLTNTSSASRHENMNTAMTSVSASGIVLPRLVYLPPAQISGLTGMVSTRANVNTVNATPMKLQTTCATDSFPKLSEKIVTTQDTTVEINRQSAGELKRLTTFPSCSTTTCTSTSHPLPNVIGENQVAVQKCIAQASPLNPENDIVQNDTEKEIKHRPLITPSSECGGKSEAPICLSETRVGIINDHTNSKSLQNEEPLSEKQIVKGKQVESVRKAETAYAQNNRKTRTEEMQELLTCKQCYTEFSTFFELKQHKVFHHMNKSKLDSTKQGKIRKGSSAVTKTKYKNVRQKRTRIIACEYCGKRFISVCLLRHHIDVSHQVNNYYACKNLDCCKIFNSRFESQHHLCANKPGDTLEDKCIRAIRAMNRDKFSIQDMKRYILQHDIEDCRHLFDKILDKVASIIESVQEYIGDFFHCRYCNKRFAYCGDLKSHLKIDHADIVAQCVDCQEYFLNETSLLEHRRDCAVKGFSDEDFHTKKKILGCDVCFSSFVSSLRLALHMQDVNFLCDNSKTSKPLTRKNLFEVEANEAESTIVCNTSRKFVCVGCKNEYCNAEDFCTSMKGRLAIEKNIADQQEATNASVEKKEIEVDEIDTKTKGSDVEMQNVFFCHDCEAIVCFSGGDVCSACFKHLCYGSETII